MQGHFAPSLNYGPVEYRGDTQLPANRLGVGVFAFVPENGRARLHRKFRQLG
jgi:hypothetical protein